MPFMKERLKDMRIRQGATLLEVADTIGVNESTVQKYESGVIHKIDTGTVERLALAVKCCPGYLMGWTNEEGEISGIKVNGPISGSQVLNANNGSSISIADKQISSQALELVEIFESLDLRRQNKLVNFALKLESEADAEKNKNK